MLIKSTYVGWIRKFPNVSVLISIRLSRAASNRLWWWGIFAYFDGFRRRMVLRKFSTFFTLFRIFIHLHDHHREPSVSDWCFWPNISCAAFQFFLGNSRNIRTGSSWPRLIATRNSAWKIRWARCCLFCRRRRVGGCFSCAFSRGTAFSPTQAFLPLFTSGLFRPMLGAVMSISACTSGSVLSTADGTTRSWPMLSTFDRVEKMIKIDKISRNLQL